MRGNVSLCLISTFLVSIYGQVVLIDNTNLPNKTLSDWGTTHSRANDEDISLPGSGEGEDGDNAITDSEDSQTESIGAESTVAPGPDESPESVVIRSSEETAQVPVESNESEDLLDGVTENSIISTTHGPVQGHIWNESPDIISFFDIPYGRFSSLFEPPKLPDDWEEPHSVPEHSKHCPQLHINEATRAIEVTGVNDCLTLSVFVPREAQNASVLFHIHDGSFTTGSGNPSIYGPEHLLSKGVILVLPNYRLGPLGFLCLQNKTAPGNAALKDLTLALNWTKDNIEHFGGNPNNIVVSGDGKSGALAGYLALSPVSRDNVYKVIAESGSVLSHWAIDRDPVATATILADKIRSSHKDHKFDDDDLFSKIGLEMLLLDAQGIHLSPCVEKGSDTFISQTPWHILNNEKITKTFMIGSASYAGLHEAYSHDSTSISKLNEDFSTFLPNDLFFKSDKEQMDEVANKIKDQYFGENDIIAGSKELALSYTDAWYISPVIRAARVLAEAGAKVYLYEFAFVGDLNRERAALGSEVNGSARGDIVGYLFTQGGQLPEPGSKEEAMINLMTDLWTSFISYGSPSSGDVKWNQLESTTEDKEEWLWIGPKPQSRKGCNSSRLQLWTDIYKEHFVERNIAHGLQRNPVLVIAAISLIGVFPKTMRAN